MGFILSDLIVVFGEDGALFRGRFKAILVDKENYLLRLSRYIHLNPVAAKLVDSPEDFLWSSYQFFISSFNRPNWFSIHETLDFFGESAKEEKYRLFVEAGVDKETQAFYLSEKLKPVLGSKTFCKLINETHIKNKQLTNMPDAKLICERPTIQHILNSVSIYYKISLNQITKQKGKTKTDERRLLSVYLCCQLTDIKLQEVANIFGTTPNNVSKICSRFKIKLEQNDELKIVVSRIKSLIYSD